MNKGLRLPAAGATLKLALIGYFAPELRAWYGLLPLWKVFWGYGVLASAVMIGFHAVALAEHRLVAQQVLLIFFAAYTVWIVVSVWRCAARSDSYWSPIARFLTVAWAANAALVVVFLQLDLLIQYVGS